jgi:hypothetical protein
MTYDEATHIRSRFIYDRARFTIRRESESSHSLWSEFAALYENYHRYTGLAFGGVWLPVPVADLL